MYLEACYKRKSLLKQNLQEPSRYGIPALKVDFIPLESVAVSSHPTSEGEQSSGLMRGTTNVVLKLKYASNSILYLVMGRSSIPLYYRTVVLVISIGMTL